MNTAKASGWSSWRSVSCSSRAAALAPTPSSILLDSTHLCQVNAPTAATKLENSAKPNLCLTAPSSRPCCGTFTPRFASCRITRVQWRHRPRQPTCCKSCVWFAGEFQTQKEADAAQRPPSHTPSRATNSRPEARYNATSSATAATVGLCQ